MSEVHRDKLHNLAEEGEDRPHAYSTPQSPNFSIQFSELHGGTVTAHKGVLRLTDTQEAELQKMIKKGRPDLTQNLIPLKMAEAEAMARADIIARNQANRGGANTMNTTEGTKRHENIAMVDVIIPPGTSEALANKMRAEGEQIKHSAAQVNQNASLSPNEAEVISTQQLAGITDKHAGNSSSPGSAGHNPPEGLPSAQGTGDGNKPVVKSLTDRLKQS